MAEPLPPPASIVSPAHVPRVRSAVETVAVQPMVTVIMPVRDEGAFLARSLGAVLAQDYPPNRLEVIVADGRSSDDTRTHVARLAAAHSHIAVSCIDNPGRIVATGFNAALAEASGDVILRVDGHTVVARDYVRQCVAALARTDADNVGGRMDAKGEGAIGRAIAAATSSPFGVGNARFHYSEREEWVDTVYLGAWRRDVFHRFGTFDEEQVRDQDDEFNYRLRAGGGKILLCPEIRSQYRNRSTLRSVGRQYFQYGFWKVRVMQKHPRQMQWRQFVPAVFVATLAVLSIWAACTSLGRWLLAAFVLLYAAANLLATGRLWRREGWRSLTLVPVVFATLHIAYGLGFLLGLARFCSRWGRK